MDYDKHTPLIDRERETKARVHDTLTKAARERLSVITSDLATDCRPDAMNYLIKRVGTSPLKPYFERNTYGNVEKVGHRKFITDGETIHVLTYIELILKNYHVNKATNQTDSFPQKRKIASNPEKAEPTQQTIGIINDIEDVLVTEGILYDLRRVGEGGVIEFTPLESEGMKEIDEQLRDVANKQPWGGALKGYNDAFDRYLSGDFDEQIPKKLYYSIEEVLKIICVDEEGWTDNRELTHSDYLEMLKENGVYNAHGVTATELSDLLDSLERMVAKVSDERHQRHAYYDRTYATLLIHQVGSYLYFLINRYEDFKN